MFPLLFSFSFFLFLHSVLFIAGVLSVEGVDAEDGEVGVNLARFSAPTGECLYWFLVYVSDLIRFFVDAALEDVGVDVGPVAVDKSGGAVGDAGEYFVGSVYCCFWLIVGLFSIYFSVVAMRLPDMPVLDESASIAVQWMNQLLQLCPML